MEAVVDLAINTRQPRVLSSFFLKALFEKIVVAKKMETLFIFWLLLIGESRLIKKFSQKLEKFGDICRPVPSMQTSLLEGLEIILFYGKNYIKDFGNLRFRDET